MIMNTRMRQLLIGLGLLVAVVGFLWFKAPFQQSHAPVVRLPVVPHEQPVYQGKPLSHWVIKAGEIDLNGVNKDAIEAIRVIGSNAVPFLLDWMPRRETIHQYGNRSSDTPDWGAVEIAWWALGSEGKSAIPVLASIINQPRRSMDDYSVWTESAQAISYLGPDAIAPMLTAVTNIDRKSTRLN